jgi:protein-S-isoprenylcysteine O-methyltransferase Ste14
LASRSLRVPLGYLTGIAVLVLARPRPWLVGVGFAVAVLGEGLRLWASGHIEKAERLATGGPYAHTRNPLYLGSVVLAAGAAVACGSLWVAAALGAYLLAFYPTAIRREAALLRERFGAAYEEWSREVPAFLPSPWPAGPRASRFDWARVRRNREWRAVTTLPLVALLLYARALF